MLVAIGRQLMIGIAVIVLVGISAIVWPIDDVRPDRQLAAAGARLCLANDETLLVGVALEGEQFGDELVMVASRIPTLQRISLAETTVTRRGIRSLQALKQLKTLNLSHTRWTVETLDVIAGFQSLRELRLEGCEWLRDDHLAYLAPLKKLEILSLAETSISSASFEHLERLPNLMVLILDRCPKISDESVDALIQLCRQRRISLSLSGTEMTPAALIRLRTEMKDCQISLRPETLVGLRAIGERGQYFTDEHGEIRSFRRRTDINGIITPLNPGDLTVVSSVSSLVDVNLENTNVDNAALLELHDLPLLESLRISSTFVTDDGLQVLERFPNLRSLWLMENEIDGFGLANLRHVPRLTNLRIQVRRGNEILSYLQSLTELKMLTIRAPLTDEGASQLAHLSNLETLTLIETQIRSPGITSLAAILKLNTLRFDGGPLDDLDIESIASLTSLRSVTLSQTKVTRSGRERLSKLLPQTAVHWSAAAEIIR